MMESMHYVNIFETKGLEYLLLISFLVLFIFLIRYLRGSSESEEREAGRRSEGPRTRPD